MQRLTRTSYRNPEHGEERDGATARRESLFDLEQYLQPWGRGHAALHVSGVATGLEVQATADGAGLRVQPGVALTARGDHIVLAEGGRALLGSAVLPVAPDGVVLPVAGLGEDGGRVLTVAFAETFDRDTFVATQGRELQIDHRPAFALRPAGDVDPLDDVVLGQVSVVAGRVTDVRPGTRTPSTARLVLHRVGRVPESGVEHVEAGELRALAQDGVVLESGSAHLILSSKGTVFASGTARVMLSRDVAFAADAARMTLSPTGFSVGRDGAAAALRVDVSSGAVRTTGALEVGGRVGIGTSEPQDALHVAGGAIRVQSGSGTQAGITYSPLGEDDVAFIQYVQRGGTTRGLVIETAGSNPQQIDLRMHGETQLSIRGSGTIVQGRLDVDGTLTKRAGQFRIDHPLDPERRHLSHSFVESDEMKNVYDGTVVLDARGTAEIAVPDWFEALNERFRYQLTPLGQPAPELHVLHRMSGNRFGIAGGPPGAEVCWQVTGVRHDTYAQEHPMVVESDKEAAPWSG